MHRFPRRLNGTGQGGVGGRGVRGGQGGVEKGEGMVGGKCFNASASVSASHSLVELHDLSSVPLPGSSTPLPKLRQLKGCINGWSRGAPTPYKHQPATKASMVSNHARKGAPSIQQKQRSLQCQSQECTNHHTEVTNYIYCIHYFSSRIKPTSHRSP